MTDTQSRDKKKEPNPRIMYTHCQSGQFQARQQQEISKFLEALEDEACSFESVMCVTDTWCQNMQRYIHMLKPSFYFLPSFFRDTGITEL